MKKLLLSVALTALAIGATAQSHLRIWQKGESNRMKIANMGDITFSGNTLNMKGQTYNLTDIDSIVVVPEVTISYEEGKANVTITKNANVQASVNGAHVTLTNNDTSNEVEITLKGNSTNGSLTYNGAYKCTFILDGLSLTNPNGSPLDIQCGKRVALVLNDGTTNNLYDGANGTQKACLYCKGHLEIEGNGTLNVSGNARHAIASKEYLQLKRSTGTINILKAASDGIHCGQYFQMNGGTINIDANTMADGIQAEAILKADGTVDTQEEQNGQIIIKGGTINEVITHEDCKGIKCDRDVTISGGTIKIDANGNGSRGIQTDGSMTIGETDAKTNITINANGALCTNPDCEEDPHRCMGIKVDGNLTVTGGITTVTNTGKKSRGIKVGGTYSKTGGTVNATITN